MNIRKPYNEAVATISGWAHHVTGELLVSLRGLENPISYYKANAGKNSFKDPSSIKKNKQAKAKQVEEITSELPVQPVKEVVTEKVEEVVAPVIAVEPVEPVEPAAPKTTNAGRPAGAKNKVKTDEEIVAEAEAEVEVLKKASKK